MGRVVRGPSSPSTGQTQSMHNGLQTGRKETGESEMGGKTTGEKEKGGKMTGTKEMGRWEWKREKRRRGGE